jgi:hypothetical protein
VREHCNNCAFGMMRWPTPDRYIVECHKRAPITIIEVVNHRETDRVGDIIITEPVHGPVAKWPEVNRDDFCGEWELKGAE